jgi:hypothetical protein
MGSRRSKRVTIRKQRRLEKLPQGDHSKLSATEHLRPPCYAILKVHCFCEPAAALREFGQAQTH